MPEKKWKITNLPHTVKVDYLLNFTHYFYLFSTLMLIEVKLSEIYNCKVKKIILLQFLHNANNYSTSTHILLSDIHRNAFHGTFLVNLHNEVTFGTWHH